MRRYVVGAVVIALIIIMLAPIANARVASYNRRSGRCYGGFNYRTTDRFVAELVSSRGASRQDVLLELRYISLITGVANTLNIIWDWPKQ